jgi:hypothetical protein
MLRRDFPSTINTDLSNTTPSVNRTNTNTTYKMAEIQSPPVQSVDAPDTSLETATSTELVPTTEQTTVTTNAEGRKVKRIIRKKRRPAPPQVDPATVKKEEQPQ